jgi:hypothetical protein
MRMLFTTLTRQSNPRMETFKLPKTLPSVTIDSHYGQLLRFHLKSFEEINLLQEKHPSEAGMVKV